jgi:hypothetical protein
LHPCPCDQALVIFIRWQKPNITVDLFAVSVWCEIDVLWQLELNFLACEHTRNSRIGVAIAGVMQSIPSIFMSIIIRWS